MKQISTNDGRIEHRCARMDFDGCVLRNVSRETIIGVENTERLVTIDQIRQNVSRETKNTVKLLENV